MKTGAKVGLGLIIATGVGAGIYFGFIRKDANGKTWAQRLVGGSEPDEVSTDPTIQPVPGTTQPSPTPTPPAPTTSPVANESFPLTKGMRGPSVRSLQTALINKFSIGIIGGADGVFGNKTEGALRLAGYSLPISQNDYTDILAGKRKGVLSDGSPVYVSKNEVVLLSYPSLQSQYMIKDPGALSRIATFNLSVNKLGTYVEPAGAGYSKIKVSRPYGKNLVGEYFVRNQDIKFSPY